MKMIYIGVQARVTSQRLPGKVLMTIDGKTYIDHILYQCSKTMKYMNKHAEKSGFYVNYALLVPNGDKLKGLYSSKVTVIEGDEHDVLSRYVKLRLDTQSDYVVRITADCPMMDASIITKHINVALRNEYDYVANCFEGYRTFCDGHDVEVVSKKALDWLSLNAVGSEREHVTLRLRTKAPFWLKSAIVMKPCDESEIKYSVDVMEDHLRVKQRMENGIRKRKTAMTKLGKRNVFNFG